MGVGVLVGAWVRRSGAGLSDLFSLVLLRKTLLIERTFEYNRGMELGDSTSTAMDAALDALNEALTDLITTVESGALERLKAEEKVAVWQRFETIRNQLPLVDHSLIADAESQPSARRSTAASTHQPVPGAGAAAVPR